MSIVNYVAGREQGKKKAIEAARSVALRRLVSFDDQDVVWNYLNNDNVIKVYTSLLKVRDSVGLEISYMFWATESMISDLRIFNKAIQFVDFNREVRLDIEVEKSSILGSFQDMSEVQFLYIVNESDNCIVQNAALENKHYYFLSNSDKLLKVKTEDSQINLANHLRIIMEKRLQKLSEMNVFISHADISNVDWDLEVKNHLKAFNNLEEDLQNKLNQIFARTSRPFKFL